MVSAKTKYSKLLKVLYILVVIVIMAYTLMPILWTLGSSLRSDDEIFKHAMPLSIHTFIPENLTLSSYIQLFTQYEFWRPLSNSFIVSVATVALGFIVNALAGFAFAKFRFKGRNLLFTIYLFSFMIPFEMIAVPLYKTVNSLKMLDTYAALIIPMVANGMIVFLYRQFFQDIPDAILESATIDGAGTLRVFFQIIIPLSKPVIISASLMMFIQQWDSFLWPLVAATSKSMKVIQVAISEFTLEFTVLWSVIFAATIIAILIPVFILIPLQKYYIQGVSSAGLKE